MSLQPQPLSPPLPQLQSQASSSAPPTIQPQAKAPAPASPKPALNSDGRSATPRGPQGTPNHSSLPNLASSSSADASAAPHSQLQLAIMLSTALAEIDSLQRELAAAHSRTSRAERLLNTVQGLPGSPNASPGSGSNAAHQTAADGSAQPAKDKDTKECESRLPESAVKAILNAEARAERAERTHAELVASLSTLSAQYADLERYEHACSLRATDALASFSRILSSVTHSAAAYANYSPKFSAAASPRREHAESLNLPPLPLPHSTTSPMNSATVSVAPATVSAALPPASSRYSRTLPAYGANTSHAYATHTQGQVRQNASNTPFFDLPLPPPPSAAGLSTSTANSLVVPAKRGHRSRSNRADDAYADRDHGEKRRRVGPWDADNEAAASSLQHAYPHASVNYSHHNIPLSAHPTVPHASSRAYDSHLSSHPGIVPNSSSWAQSSIASLSHSQSGYVRERESAVPPMSASPASKYDRYEARGSSLVRPTYDDHRDIRDIRVDARELVRDAKERERRGREAAVATRGDYYASRDSRLHLHSRHAEANGNGSRRRSLSRGSVESSWSIDEMLLETATDRERDRERDSEERRRRDEGMHREPPTLQQYQTHVFTPPVTGAPAKKPPPQVSPGNSTNGDARVNASINASIGANGASSNNAHVSSNVPKPTVPPNQLVTLGPSGMVISGGAMPGGGGFPPQNAQGQRICRQCGVPGRYKDGKCVEKWGPGPEGPGTVCDRCRKKMKRVERRGTLDAASAGQHAQMLAHRHTGSGSQLLAQQASSSSLPVMQSSSGSAQNRSRGSVANTSARQDTVLLDQGSNRVLNPSAQSSSHLAATAATAITGLASPAAHSHYREHQHREHGQSQVEGESQSRASGGSSRSHTGSPTSGSGYGSASVGRMQPGGSSATQAYGSVASLQQHSSNAAMSATAGGTGAGAGIGTHRRPPTPPYITSISTREQYANSGGGGRSGSGSGNGSSSPSHARTSHAHAHAHAHPHAHSHTNADTHARTHAQIHPHSHTVSHASGAAPSVGMGSGSGTGSRGSSVNEEDLLDGDAEDDVMLGEGDNEAEGEGDADNDGDDDNDRDENDDRDGDGDGDGDLDVDAEIARAVNGPTPVNSPSPHHKASSGLGSGPGKRGLTHSMIDYANANANGRLHQQYHGHPHSYHYRGEAATSAAAGSLNGSMGPSQNQKRAHVALPGVVTMESQSRQSQSQSQSQHQQLHAGSDGDDADRDGDGDGDGDGNGDSDGDAADSKAVMSEYDKIFNAADASTIAGSAGGVPVGGMKVEE